VLGPRVKPADDGEAGANWTAPPRVHLPSGAAPHYPLTVDFAIGGTNESPVSQGK
jgi:hypothetical protein